MEEKRKIHINLCGRTFPLYVTQENESFIREAVDRVNSKVTVFQNKYVNRDIQDALSIAVLEIAARQVVIEGEIKKSNSLAERIESLDNQLEQYILSTSEDV